MSSCHHCHHDRAAHEHYRRGTDCAQCDCARFRRTTAGSLIAAFRHRHAAERDAPPPTERQAPAA